MPLDLQNDCVFNGPALPLPFVTLNLEAELNRLRLLPRSTGEEANALSEFWTTYRAHLRQLVSQGGPQRVKNQVIEPLLACGLLGYTAIEAADEVTTREGRESGGSFLVAPDGRRLRFWTTTLNEDFDAPARRGEAYRFSHARVASRVLLAAGERLGILTNGTDLRLLICDPARLDSSVSITLDSSWKRSRDVPDSFRFFVALARPEGVAAIAELIEKARLLQAKVTKDLRTQARLAVEEFIQAVLDAPENQELLSRFTDRAALARALWHEGLVTVYRLLFILKLESTDDPAKCFSFASGSLWRNTFSPGVALAPLARAVLDRGEPTGRMLEDGLRALFRMLGAGLQSTELTVRPMSGLLFAPGSTPILSRSRWPEHGVAHLLDRLLWTTARRGVDSRERVHYGPLDVEDLGRVYEALLELDPGITTEPVCRLRRAKLEVVVPVAQGQRYRPQQPAAATVEDDTEVEEEEETEEGSRSSKTKVEWIEEIPTGRFYLRVGLGRKATGSFYTPHSFVRFLVQETLGPLVERASPREDPQPAAILALKVVDKAMGSGHFLVEACRFLGDALYEACRRCDELAKAASDASETTRNSGQIEEAETKANRAAELLRRVEDLPDPDDELLLYLPSRAPEGIASGLSQSRAIAICKRLVAIHCLYGVDKNPLAVELAKLALWIECHAEGLPLTFLDHRLVAGDSLTGPFFEHLLRYPGTQTPLDDLFTSGLQEKLSASLGIALAEIRALESTVGLDAADDLAKRAAKARLDRTLAPFRLLAAAWSGGVMLGSGACDDTGYAALARTIAETGDLPDTLDERAVALRSMLATGLGRPDFPPCASRDEVLAQLNSPDSIPAFSYDLGFPEVFYPTGDVNDRRGFDAALGNPPWDRMLPADKEFFASFDFEILNATTKRARELVQDRLLALPDVRQLYTAYLAGFRGQEAALDALYRFQIVQVNGENTIGKQDAFRAFMERGAQVLRTNGRTGLVVPAAFHANEGATGVRRLYLQEMALQTCYSFENSRTLFEIHRSFKFAAVIAEAGRATSEFSCAFYLNDDEWLFSGTRARPPLSFTLEFVRQTGGAYLTFLELKSTADFECANSIFSNGVSFSSFCRAAPMKFGRELNMTDDARRLCSAMEQIGTRDSRDPSVSADLAAGGFLPLHEGKTFHQFDDHWAEPSRYLVAIDRLNDKPALLDAARFYRISFREIARATDERTSIFALLPPPELNSYTATNERPPLRRPNSTALVLLAIGNTFCFDFVVRLKVQVHMTLYLVNDFAVPRELPLPFLAHAALRLSANHAGYEPLWREQLGEAWREAGAAWTWPALDGDAARWAVRAAVDAVVAAAYGLTREQYAHVLTTFSHTSFREAPCLCLAAFDELHRDGLEAFTHRHDPYHDIPLNEALPQPVIELPVAAATTAGEEPAAYAAADLFGNQTQEAPRRGRRRRTT